MWEVARRALASGEKGKGPRQDLQLGKAWLEWANKYMETNLWNKFLETNWNVATGVDIYFQSWYNKQCIFQIACIEGDTKVAILLFACFT